MIWVVPTDTVYGIVASAADEAAVEQIYKIKERSPDKPLIILISSVEQLTDFAVSVDEELKAMLSKFWPGPVSIVLPADKAPEYLRRQGKSLAFRLPDDERLLKFIFEHGPIVAPSANPEGQFPATTLQQARDYFGDTVDEYIDGGTRDAKPSKLIRFDRGEVEVLRG